MPDKKKSLIELAEEAKFYPIHSIVAWSRALMGCILSDKYESVYLKAVAETEEGLDFEFLGVVDPNDYDSCALYRINEKILRDNIRKNFSGYQKGGTNLDKRDPLYKGQAAVNILEAYAKTEKE